jgi:hypothetical protein
MGKVSTWQHGRQNTIAAKPNSTADPWSRGLFLPAQLTCLISAETDFEVRSAPSKLQFATRWVSSQYKNSMFKLGFSCFSAGSSIRLFPCAPRPEDWPFCPEFVDVR